MCGRITLVTFDELRDIVDAVQAGLTTTLEGGDTFQGSGSRGQARPGSVVQAIAGACARPETLDVVWGIEPPWGKRDGARPKLVFNTRLESALGKSALWARPIREGRCILPAATFFETHASETVASPKTGRPVKRAYEFAMASGAPLLLASVHDAGRLSVVTCEPNDAVSPVHPRMPLALRFDEVRTWLEGDLSDIAVLADRSDLPLALRPEPVRSGAASAGAARIATSGDSSQLSLFS